MRSSEIDALRESFAGTLAIAMSPEPAQLWLYVVYPSGKRHAREHNVSLSCSRRVHGDGTSLIFETVDQGQRRWPVGTDYKLLKVVDG